MIYNLRYLLYCKSNKLTPAKMLIRDRKEYPGGSMCGFICWTMRKVAEHLKAVPENRLGYSFGNPEIYDNWLRLNYKN